MHTLSALRSAYTHSTAGHPTLPADGCLAASHPGPWQGGTHTAERWTSRSPLHVLVGLHGPGQRLLIVAQARQMQVGVSAVALHGDHLQVAAKIPTQCAHNKCVQEKSLRLPRYWQLSCECKGYADAVRTSKSNPNHGFPHQTLPRSPGVEPTERQSTAVPGQHGGHVGGVYVHLGQRRAGGGVEVGPDALQARARNAAALV